MIVATMNEQEIIREVLGDMVNAFRWEDRNHNRFRRLVLKSTRFPVYSHYSYTSPKKNKWLILLQAQNKKEFGDNSRTTYVATYNSPHGIYAIMVSFINENPHLIFYPPHFFRRYRERMDLDLHGDELLVEFFRYNSGYVFEHYLKDSGGGEKILEIAGSTNDGVALGIQSVNGNLLFKTFVTYDMLKGEQIEVYTKNELIRKELHEEYKL